MKFRQTTTFPKPLARIACAIVFSISFSLNTLAQDTKTKSILQEVEVDAELVLAVDVSRSMSAWELEIQRRGYAEALVDEEVIRAITSGLIGRIAIIYVEWAGSFSQRIIVDWTLIESEADARAFATKLTANFDSSMRRTSISGAIDHATTLFENNGYIANRQIIDISGDGPNNQGRSVIPARDEALEKGIVINGLPLMTRDGIGSQFHLEDLDLYYQNCVIGGPGAFVIPVLEWEQFPTAVRQKIILELAGAMPQIEPEGLAPTILRTQNIGAREEGYDCLIGEKIWDNFRQLWQILP